MKKQTKTKVLFVRLTPAEKKDVEHEARRQGMTEADLARRAVAAFVRSLRTFGDAARLAP